MPRRRGVFVLVLRILAKGICRARTPFQSHTSKHILEVEDSMVSVVSEVDNMTFLVSYSPEHNNMNYFSWHIHHILLLLLQFDRMKRCMTFFIMY
jgi:hypothetical protein